MHNSCGHDTLSIPVKTIWLQIDWSWFKSRVRWLVAKFSWCTAFTLPPPSDTQGENLCPPWLTWRWWCFVSWSCWEYRWRVMVSLDAMSPMFLLDDFWWRLVHFCLFLAFSSRRLLLTFSAFLSVFSVFSYFYHLCLVDKDFVNTIYGLVVWCYYYKLIRNPSFF